MEKINNTLSILKSYNYLGEKMLSDKTHLIGKAPHIAESAWLHSIYPALTDIQINELEKKLKTSIPNDYIDFLKITNGLNVFNTTFSLFGLRKNYKRSSDGVWQPFDILTPNNEEKPRNANENVFIVGTYDWDGSYVYIDKKTNKTHLCENEDVTSIYEWKDFNSMLLSEIKRLCKLFDKSGKEKFPDMSTLPSSTAGAL